MKTRWSFLPVTFCILALLWWLLPHSPTPGEAIENVTTINQGTIDSRIRFDPAEPEHEAPPSPIPPELTEKEHIAMAHELGGYAVSCQLPKEYRLLASMYTDNRFHSVGQRLVGVVHQKRSGRLLGLSMPDDLQNRYCGSDTEHCDGYEHWRLDPDLPPMYLGLVWTVHDPEQVTECTIEWPERLTIDIAFAPKTEKVLIPELGVYVYESGRYHGWIDRGVQHLSAFIHAADADYIHREEQFVEGPIHWSLDLTAPNPDRVLREPVTAREEYEQALDRLDARAEAFDATQANKLDALYDRLTFNQSMLRYVTETPSDFENILNDKDMTQQEIDELEDKTVTQMIAEETARIEKRYDH